MATLCYQELHGVAVNFLKSYLAVALQGAVLYLVIGFTLRWQPPSAAGAASPNRRGRCWGSRSFYWWLCL